MTRDKRRPRSKSGPAQESDHHVDTKRKRITMTWIRFSDSWYDRPETRDLSYAARVAFIGALSYSARHNTDGLIPEDVAETLIRAKDYEAAAAELFEQGHWTRTDDGQVYVVEWAEHLRSGELVKADLQRKRENQARYMERGRSNTTSADRSADRSAKRSVTTSRSAPPRSETKGEGEATPSASLGLVASPDEDKKTRLDRYSAHLPLAVRIKNGLALSDTEERTLHATLGVGTNLYGNWSALVRRRYSAARLMDEHGGDEEEALKFWDRVVSGKAFELGVKSWYEFADLFSPEPCDLTWEAHAIGRGADVTELQAELARDGYCQAEADWESGPTAQVTAEFIEALCAMGFDADRMPELAALLNLPTSDETDNDNG